MAETYWNVSPHSVLSSFRCAAPCNCHEENAYTPPTYNVRTTTSGSYLGGKGAMIKKIHIECTACGKEKTTDVEHLEVYEKEFEPY